MARLYVCRTYTQMRLQECVQVPHPEGRGNGGGGESSASNGINPKALIAPSHQACRHSDIYKSLSAEAKMDAGKNSGCWLIFPNNFSLNATFILILLMPMRILYSPYHELKSAAENVPRTRWENSQDCNREERERRRRRGEEDGRAYESEAGS